ncbi:hypothetical protein HAX54_053454 [Datura stramonium]|uniref:Uncharacterized protein n=1 Tax=Datura stramonium TaxID=4076 RepID=A0ABS8WTI1_DATST|nr:hypothetical protein [Datura stramonium]
MGDNTLAEDKAVLVASLISGEDHVPILVGIDVKTYATKKYDLEKSKDETRYELELYKPVIEVFEFGGPIAKVVEATTGLAEAGVESAETSSVVHQPSQYAFIQVNFAKVVNDRLKVLIVPHLVRFEDELKKAQDDILKLQQERQPQEFPKYPRDDVVDEGKSHKKNHKKRKKEKAELREAQRLSRVEEEMRLKEMRAWDGGTSSSSAPIVEGNMTSVAVSSKS